jgi:hypothetical protein
MFSNALVWIIMKILNFITSGDGLNPGDFESPPGHRARIGATQEDLLETWKILEVELQAWYCALPPNFTECVRRTLALSDLTLGLDGHTEAIDAILYTTPMCAVTVQTYHMARILLLMNKPQESTAIRSTVTARIKSYREISASALEHARAICGISVGGLPDAARTHTVQPLFVAGQCLDRPGERQLVIGLLWDIERDLGWATNYRVQDLFEQWCIE